MVKVTGYFSEIKDANKTVDELKNLGFDNAFVDINDHYIGNRNVERNIVGTENGQILSDLVLNSGSRNVDVGKGPLLAASPIVSGYGNLEEITDINYSVIVECNEENINKAKDIISQMGGQLDDPNVSRYKTAMDTGIDLSKAIDEIDNNMNI